MHGDVGIVPQAEDDLAVVRDRASVPGDVDVTAPRSEPRERADESLRGPRCIVRLVDHSSDSHLTEVVPARPREVSDEMSMGLDELPVAVDGPREALGAD